jgi:hypothetical protein
MRAMKKMGRRNVERVGRDGGALGRGAAPRIEEPSCGLGCEICGTCFEVASSPTEQSLSKPRTHAAASPHFGASVSGPDFYVWDEDPETALTWGAELDPDGPGIPPSRSRSG